MLIYSFLPWCDCDVVSALVGNQSIAAQCNTAANCIVTCENVATIVTKALEDLVQVTCVTQLDDRRTVMTSKRACVVLVPHGTLGSITHMSFLDGSILNCVVQFTVYNIVQLFKLMIHMILTHIVMWGTYLILYSILVSSDFASYQSEGDIY